MSLAKIVPDAQGQLRAAFPLRATLLAVTLLLYPMVAAQAQSGGPNAAGDPRLAINPVLSAVAQVTPASLPIVFRKLDSLTTGVIAPGSRGDGAPTPAERTQLARNPAFQAAFVRNPDETLRLLRWVNAETGGLAR
jgi:hypothetical protein